MRATPTTALAAALSVCAATPALPAKPDIAKFATVDVLSPETVPCDCGPSGVALSPDGRFFVLYGERLERSWRASLQRKAFPSQLAVIETACFERSGDLTTCSIGTVKAPMNFNGHVWWSRDSRTVFLTLGDDYLGAVRVTEGGRAVAPHGRPLRMKTWFGDLSHVISPSPSSSIAAEQLRVAAAAAWRDRIEESPDHRSDFARYKVTLHGDGMTVTGRLRNSLDFAVLTDPQRQQPEKIGYSTVAFGTEPTADLLPGVDGNWWVARGAVARRNSRTNGGASWDMGPAPSPFGQRPVMQADTGKLVGLHTEAAVIWLEPNEKLRKLELQLREWATGGYVIHSLQLAAGDTVAFALLSHAGRGGMYLVHRWDAARQIWVQTLQDCPSTENRFDADAETLNIGTATWPVPARWYRREGAQRLVVLLKGGPASTVQWDAALGAHPYRHLPPGQDLITFDVSGAAGGSADVADRLRDGPSALTHDINYINAFLRRIEGRYQHVSLLAVSFGGVIAPGVIKGLDARLDRIALVVPYAKVRSPTELKSHSERRPGEFTMLFHREYMGAGEDLASWLSQQYAGLAVDARYALVFASRDDSSRPEDIPAHARAGRKTI